MIEGLKEEPSCAFSDDAQVVEQLDDYTIVRELGRGGMGVVFEAIHQSLGRRVALKILARRLVGDTKHLTRFRREARAAARLRHPNIVSVFGVGQADDHHYYVMDFINGMSLRQWLHVAHFTSGTRGPRKSSERKITSRPTAASANSRSLSKGAL